MDFPKICPKCDNVTKIFYFNVTPILGKSTSFLIKVRWVSGKGTEGKEHLGLLYGNPRLQVRRNGKKSVRQEGKGLIGQVRLSQDNSGFSLQTLKNKLGLKYLPIYGNSSHCFKDSKIGSAMLVHKNPQKYVKLLRFEKDYYTVGRLTCKIVSFQKDVLKKMSFF